jgi:glycosyltransferase involved in cell wall biosynthesis
LSNSTPEKDLPATTAFIESSPTVAILLSTFNGSRYLAEQLDSIVAQTHDNWLIVASDDGSSDGTLSILERYRQQLGPGRLRIVQGPGRGFAANFLSMAADNSVEADFFAFCDQDDLWYPQKLKRALGRLMQQSADQPLLYCSRTRLVDAAGLPLGLSPLFNKQPSFRNALVQNLAGGNTMVFNRKMQSLLAIAGNIPVVAHDWWLYLLATGCGARVHYDDVPSLDYRQHDGNLIGSNASFSDRLNRIQRMLLGHFRQWNEINLQALAPQIHLLTPQNRRILEHFIKARHSPYPLSIAAFLKSGVHRQTLLGNFGLAVAVLLRRV